MNDTGATTRVQTIIVGGGQAGLSVGYHLSRTRPSFPNSGCEHAYRGRMA